MGRIGSWVPRHIESAAFVPHCWKFTSFADPEYVMDFRSPNAFCALAITVFASCAIAFAQTNARQIATAASFFNTAFPPFPFMARNLKFVFVHGLRANSRGSDPLSGNSAATGP